MIEVGLGGRLDATNAADLGVAAITTVQHDHERHLGRTLAAIGGEKAAIIKRGNLAVTGATGRGLAPVVARANAVQAPLHRAGAGPGLGGDASPTPAGMGCWSTSARRTGGCATSGSGCSAATRGRMRPWPLPFSMPSRPMRCAAADRFPCPSPSCGDGLAAARWPGRLEWFADACGGRGVLLDGAHNPAGARALAAALAELGVRRFPLVFGAMRGKRVSAVLRALAPLDPQPVFTAVADPHAHSPAELLRAWQRIHPGTRGTSRGTHGWGPGHGPGRRRRPRTARGPVVVAGSLYLVGAVRAHLTGERVDP